MLCRVVKWPVVALLGIGWLLVGIITMSYKGWQRCIRHTVNTTRDRLLSDVLRSCSGTKMKLRGNTEPLGRRSTTWQGKSHPRINLLHPLNQTWLCALFEAVWIAGCTEQRVCTRLPRPGIPIFQHFNWKWIVMGLPRPWMWQSCWSTLYQYLRDSSPGELPSG